MAAFQSYYSGPHGKRFTQGLPKYLRDAVNGNERHWDPFDPEADRWPGDRYLHYTWSHELGWYAECNNAIDDSGGV